MKMVVNSLSQKYNKIRYYVACIMLKKTNFSRNLNINTNKFL